MTAGSLGGAGSRPRHLVVMGVSGVGKSTVAEALASRLGYRFAEGDRFHPEANIAKMSAGEPLDDDDRMPWLQALADWVSDRDREGVSTVMTCSALRRRYRDVLRSAAGGVYFVHLVGSQDLLLERMRQRRHFMPPALLRSQFDTLEQLGADEPGSTVDVRVPAAQVVDRVLEQLPG